MATPEGRPDEQTGPLRLGWFRRLLPMVGSGGTLVDLGAGHGLFSIIAADLGWQVTAQDARGDRFPEDSRITWEVSDVRDVDVSAFDVIACLGLFYHLTLDDQLQLLDKARGRPLILDTHVANGRPTPCELTSPLTLRGYRGQHYIEPDQAAHSTASWGNEKSFWPRPRALYRMLDERGYDVLTANPWYLPTRTFFLCLPR
jgi:hypothetical protein